MIPARPLPLRSTRPTFRAAGAFLAALAFIVTVAPAARAADLAAAQQFVQNVSNQAIQILRQKDNRAQRDAAFQNLMQQNVDLPRVARFTLGRYWRVASPQQQQEYERLFKTYMVRIYSTRLDQYAGETVAVTGATPAPDNPNQVLVHSTISGPNRPEPVKVDWRVRLEGGDMKLIDIVVEGASMAVTQRSEFASVIDNNGGNVQALLDKMSQVAGQG